jgi:hypothetical protein
MGGICLVLIRLKAYLPKKTLHMDDITNVADAKEGIFHLPFFFPTYRPKYLQSPAEAILYTFHS